MSFDNEAWLDTSVFGKGYKFNILNGWWLDTLLCKPNVLEYLEQAANKPEAWISARSTVEMFAVLQEVLDEIL